MRTTRLTRLALAGAALAIVAGACSSSDQSGAESDPTDSELPAVLEEIVAETGVPGMGAAALTGTNQLDMAVAGIRSSGDIASVTVDDRFHLGSNTKAMTAALLGVLSDKGVGISFDTTVADAFPQIAVHPGYQSVTLADLLAHTGGTPGDTPDVDDEFLGQPVTEQRAQAAELVLSEAPEIEPGTLSHYSNLGYVIVGAALEQATGSAWEELMQTEIFDALGMPSCGFGAPGTEETVDQPRGHDAGGEPIFGDLPPVLGPAGTVHCSMHDWGMFLTEQLNGANGASEFFSAATTDRIFRPIDGIPVENYDGARAALGWIVFDSPNGLVYWHNGSNTMWYSEAFLVPAIDRVVLGVSNQEPTGSAAVTAALAALAEMYPA